MRQELVHLAGEEIHGNGHVGAFFRNRADADRTLIPFVREGLDRGDRIVRIVASARRDAYVSTLRDAGVDVDGAQSSGALLVETWENTYLRGGRFEQTAMLTLILGILAAGRSAGYPRTRYIADMEWALRGPTPVEEVVEYEARADRALRKLPDVVICSYHPRRFGAPVIVDILGVHPLALVGGALRQTRSDYARTTPRERILRAADRLFRSQGIGATSVDAIIADADVAKATIYRHFPTKDDLIVGWLQDAGPRWFDEVLNAAQARAGADGNAIPASLFDALADRLAADDYRGWPFFNVSVEIADPSHPARAIVREYLSEVEDRLAAMLALTGFDDPGRLAARLIVLVLGSMALAVGSRSPEPMMTASAVATDLLRLADRSRPPTSV
ncbi:MAG TPA: MEDS domain-containing protein [Candidatus Acidoferrum sp.]|nr:MEDS domain-containing protein [Candidatus Acidoferrum sp.]